MKHITESEELQIHIADHIRKSISPSLIQRIAEDAISKSLNNGEEKYWPEIERVIIEQSQSMDWIYLEDLKNLLAGIEISSIKLKRLLLSKDYQVHKHYGAKHKSAVFI